MKFDSQSFTHYNLIQTSKHRRQPALPAHLELRQLLQLEGPGGLLLLVVFDASLVVPRGELGRGDLRGEGNNCVKCARIDYM